MKKYSATLTDTETGELAVKILSNALPFDIRWEVVKSGYYRGTVVGLFEGLSRCGASIQQDIPGTDKRIEIVDANTVEIWVSHNNMPEAGLMRHTLVTIVVGE